MRPIRLAVFSAFVFALASCGAQPASPAVSGPAPSAEAVAASSGAARQSPDYLRMRLVEMLSQSGATAADRKAYADSIVAEECVSAISENSAGRLSGFSPVTSLLTGMQNSRALFANPGKMAEVAKSPDPKAYLKGVQSPTKFLSATIAEAFDGRRACAELGDKEPACVDTAKAYVAFASKKYPAAITNLLDENQNYAFAFGRGIGAFEYDRLLQEAFAKSCAERVSRALR